ncbi:MAG: hypothetical protein AAGE01_24000 [Pseudomonadota bacterium]
MQPPDFERLQRAYAFIATEMYRATPSQLGEIDAELRRLRRLIEAYRRVTAPDGVAEAGGASHLAGGAPKPAD